MLTSHAHLLEFDRRQKKEDARASVALIRQDYIPSDAYV